MAQRVEVGVAVVVDADMVTAGQVLFALVQRWFPTRDTYPLLPFVLAAALSAVALLPRGTPALGVLTFGLSQHTVKCQALSVYRNLGVSSRSQAIRRLQQTGLPGT